MNNENLRHPEDEAPSADKSEERRVYEPPKVEAVRLSK